MDRGRVQLAACKSKSKCKCKSKCRHAFRRYSGSLNTNTPGGKECFGYYVTIGTVVVSGRVRHEQSRSDVQVQRLAK